MTRQSPDEAIAVALVTQLRSSSGMTALVSTRTYTEVPQTAEPPYVRVQLPTGRRVDTASRYGTHTLVDVVAVSQGESKRTGLRIRNAAIQALNGQALSLTSPHQVLGLTWDTNAETDDVENGVKVFQHIATFRVWTEQTA